mgnify:FL=1
MLRLATGAAPGETAGGTGHAALRACLGSAPDRAATLQALLSSDEAQVELAQAYLRQRPVDDVRELRRLTEGISALPAGPAQIRALEALGRHYVSDREVLERLVALYGQTSSAAVQTAVAGILLRADRSALPAQTLRQTLITLRRDARNGAGDGTIDALIALLDAR